MSKPSQIFVLLVIFVNNELLFIGSVKNHSKWSDGSIYFSVENEIVPVITKEYLFGLRLESTKALAIKACGVTKLQMGVFNNLDQLLNLSLSNNSLKEVRAGVFNNLRIEVLDLSHNQIGVIDNKSFHNMTKMTTLILNDNRLAVWNANWFRNNPSLCNLYFRANFFTLLPKGAFDNAGDRNSCYYKFAFSENKVKTIHKDVFRNFSIHSLHLANNGLSDISNDIFDDSCAGFLQLSGNHVNCSNTKLSQKNNCGDVYRKWPWKCYCSPGYQFFCF